MQHMGAAQGLCGRASRPPLGPGADGRALEWGRRAFSVLAKECAVLGSSPAPKSHTSVKQAFVCPSESPQRQSMAFFWKEGPSVWGLGLGRL